MNNKVEINLDPTISIKSPSGGQPINLHFKLGKFGAFMKEARWIVHDPIHQAKPDDLLGMTGLLGKVRPLTTAACRSNEFAVALFALSWPLK